MTPRFSTAWRNGYWRLMDGNEPIDGFSLQRDAVAAAAYMNAAA
jgi:hypothetical protein